MKIYRKASEKILALARSFKAVAILGPRQSGKSTLAKSLFEDYKYISFENPDQREFAMTDPKSFLAKYSNGVILDEIQRVPEIFSYLQQILDEEIIPGKYILTGSNNFLLNEKISQSLAGRIALFTLLPLSFTEVFQNKNNFSEKELILKGFYPPLYDQPVHHTDWYPYYIQTYIERDVRQIKKITDLLLFERFMKILAGRNGQELNLTSIAVDAGIDVKTSESWISVLAASYIVFLLKPHYNNYNKTLVKRPKIYFYDTGIVCSLLGITEMNHLEYHPLRGNIFESMIVSEMVKIRMNKGLKLNLFYWRDKSGHEVDLIIDNVTHLKPVEIKSSSTINTSYFENLDYWMALSGTSKGYLIYTGSENQSRTKYEVLSWNSLNDL